MLTLSCPNCRSARNVRVTAAMPLRAWVHCGACNRLWKMSTPGLLARWIAGRFSGALASAHVRAQKPPDDPGLRGADVPARRDTTTIDPAIEQWLADDSVSERRQHTSVAVSDWLETDALEQAARSTSVDAGCSISSGAMAATSEPQMLLERLDTFYEGLVKVEEFVERCAGEEGAVAEAAAHSAAAAETATGRGASMLPFTRLAG